MKETGGGDYPVCGPQVKRPVRIRILQYASVVLAVAGLGFLYLFSISRDIPLVRIGDITPAMNFAYVRIAGEVTRDAYAFQSGGIVFNVKDSNGEIAVMGGRAQAESLEASGKLPRRGDWVEVSGSLNVSADRDPRLRLQSSEQLVLGRKRSAGPVAGVRIPLGEVTSALAGSQIAVTGVLKAIDIPGPGSKMPYVLTLEESGSRLAVVFWNDVFQGLEGKLPMPGKLLSVYGQVDVYKDIVRLKVRDVGGLRVTESGK